MGNTIMVEHEAFKIEGNSIKVGHVYGAGKHSRAAFEEVPMTTGNCVILEQKPNSCYLDPEGDGARKIREFGVSDSETQKVVTDLNKIIEDLDWSVPWLNDIKPKGWLCCCIFLHFIGVCIAMCIMVSKNNAIKKKRDDLMTQAREYARNYNQNSREFDIRIPQRFTEYVELVVKPQAMAGAMNMGMMQPGAYAAPAMGFQQQPMMQPMMQPMQPMQQYPGAMPDYNQQMYAQQYQQPMYSDAQQQQMMQQPGTQGQNQTITIQLNQPQQ